MKNTWEVADIFRLYGKDYQKKNLLSYKELKTMHHITACRTAQLGGHIEQCDNCENVSPITHAGTGIAQNVSPWLKKNGSMIERLIYYPVTTFIWFLPCHTNLIQLF